MMNEHTSGPDLVIADLREQVAKLEKERDEFKRLGQQFQRESRDHFEQSCKNRQRAERAEARAEAVPQLVEVLKIIMESDLGTHWVWPETAKQTWMERARAALDARQREDGNG